MVSFIWADPKMLIELLGNLPLAIKSSVGNLVF